MSEHEGHVGDQHFLPTNQPTTPSGHEGHLHHTMMGHAMAFHFGVHETILFDFWSIDNAAGMFASCLLVALLCLVMETLRFYRARRHVAKTLSQEPVDIHDRLKFSPKLSLDNVTDAALQAAQLTLAYLLMLIFMSFNVWLCAAVVIGEVGSRFLYSTLFPYMEALQPIGGSCG